MATNSITHRAITKYVSIDVNIKGMCNLFRSLLFIILILTVTKGSNGQENQSLSNSLGPEAYTWSNSSPSPSSPGKLAPTSIRQGNVLYRVKYKDTVELSCVIENRRGAKVIWQYSKSRVPETLSIDYLYYRQDYRIRVIVNASQEEEQSWNLEIRKVRLEDEGYYLCKVMAEPELIKRAVYLKVEVDLAIKQESPHYSLGRDVALICNTSYQLPLGPSISTGDNESSFHRSVSSKHSRNNQPSQQSHPRLAWFKDGQKLHNMGSGHAINSDLVDLNNLTLASQLDLKIEYHSKPVLWSRLLLKNLKPTDMGVYTCLFRNQSVSTVLSLDKVGNNRLLESDSLINSISSRQMPQVTIIATLSILLLYRTKLF